MVKFSLVRNIRAKFASNSRFLVLSIDESGKSFRDGVAFVGFIPTFRLEVLLAVFAKKIFAAHF